MEGEEELENWQQGDERKKIDDSGTNDDDKETRAVRERRRQRKKNRPAPYRPQRHAFSFSLMPTSPSSSSSSFFLPVRPSVNSNEMRHHNIDFISSRERQVIVRLSRVYTHDEGDKLRDSRKCNDSSSSLALNHRRRCHILSPSPIYFNGETTTMSLEKTTTTTETISLSK